ncbi:MAG: gliding motility-associated C-terminal domain-containing protein [Bacteroidetes bacterium]|nr:gliding motility-associated C-terminal domain-containing protein [Bacteroidota bacterium]
MNLNVRKLIGILLMLSLFQLFIAKNVQASHIMGGSIQYTSLGFDSIVGKFKFDIRVFVYRYCEPGAAQFAPKLWLGIYSSNINQVNIDTLTWSKKINLISKKFIQPPNLSDSCATLLNVCVEEAIYAETVFLPSTNVGYNLIADVCCRNPNILNLTNPTNQGIAFFAKIPKTSIVNNSPQYAIPPVPFLCTSDTNIVSNTVYDIDGDSLDYSFAWPYNGLGPGGTTNGMPILYPDPIPKVVYAPGYSQLDPFGPSGWHSIDSLTGLTSYYNPNTGFFVVTIIIREYRNGNFIAAYRRDLQLIFIPCPVNNAPQLVGNTQIDYTINEGDSLCFPIEFVDPEGDSIFITHSGLIFDSTVVNPPAILNDVSGLAYDSTHFCWYTTCDAGGPNAYNFTVVASDDGCPPKQTYVVYTINVIPVTSNAVIQGPSVICDPNAGPFMFYVLNTNGDTANYNWLVSNGTIVGGGPGSDTIYVSNVSNALTVTFYETGPNGCSSDPLSLTVPVGSGIPVQAFSNDTICEGESTTLSASGSITYVWSDAGGVIGTGTSITVSPTVTTTYTVTGTDDVGCTSESSVTVTVNPNPALSAIAGVTSACPNLLGALYYVINGNPNSTYTWTVTGGTLISGQGTDSIIVNWGGFGTGTVTLFEVTDGNCTSQPVSISVSINLFIAVPTGPNQNICIGQTAQLGTAVVSGYSYSWSPAFGLSGTDISNPVVTINNTGTYIYTLTVSDTSGCNNTDSVVVTINPLPSISVSPSTNDTICAGDTVTLTGSGAGTFVWYNNDSLINSIGTGNPFTVNPVLTTTYYTIGSDVNGCEDIDSVTIYVFTPPPTSPVISGDTASCTNTQGLVYTVLNVVGTSTYLWNISGGVIVSGQNTPSVVVNWTGTGTATLSVYELTSDGCPSVPTTIIISLNVPAQVPTGGPQTICEGQTTILGDFPIPGYTYAWSPAFGLSSTSISNPTLTLTPAGTYLYYLYVTNAAGCNNFDSVEINVLQAPAISLSAQPSTIICPFDTIILTANGALTYTWYIVGSAVPIGTGTSITVTPSQTSTYYAIGSLGTICDGFDSITVVTHPPQTFGGITGDLNPCYDTIVYAIINPDLSATYTWTVTGGVILNGQSTPTVTIYWSSNSGTISITSLDTNGCESQPYLFNIQQGAQTTSPLATGPQTVCENQAGNYNAVVVPGGAYQWFASGGTINSGQGSSSVNITWNGPAPATGYVYYQITFSTDSFCYGMSDSLTIAILPLPIINGINGNNLLCGIDTGWYSISTAPSATIVWSTTGGTIITTANPDSIGLYLSANGTYTITVIATDTISGCVSNPASLQITKGNLINATATGGGILCPGDSIQIGVTGNGNTYQWLPATGLSSTTVSNPNASPSVTTTYTVTTGDGSGCTASASVTVTVNAQINAQISANSTTVCPGAGAQLTASGGTSYSWSPANGLSNTSIANPTANPNQNTIYTVTVSDGNCTATATIEITIGTVNAVATANANSVCLGQSVQLNASGGATYAWSPPNGLSDPSISNPTASPTTATTYTVLVTDSVGCTGTDTISLAILAAPTVAISNDTIICPGAQAQLLAAGGVQYSWQPANNLSSATVSNPVATPGSSTTYTVTVTNTDGCTATEDVIVSIDATLDADFEWEDSLDCNGATYQFINNSQNAVSYQWIFGDGSSSTDPSPTHTFTLGQAIQVTLIATNGTCSDTLVQFINIASLDTMVKNAPNVITPNGDGLNDCFEIGSIVSFRECSTFEIFDRWGELMYETGTKVNCWDGTNRDGNAVPEGVYYYILKIDKEEFNGFVHVIRN